MYFKGRGGPDCSVAANDDYMPVSECNDYSGDDSAAEHVHLDSGVVVMSTITFLVFLLHL